MVFSRLKASAKQRLFFGVPIGGICERERGSTGNAGTATPELSTDSRSGGVLLLEAFFALQVVAKRLDSDKAEIVIAQLGFGEVQKVLVFQSVKLSLNQDV
jgi:hypothetical protein